MSIEVANKSIHDEHAPKGSDGLIHIRELAIVLKHSHDVDVFVLVSILVLFERAFTYIVEGHESCVADIEITTNDNMMFFISTQ